MIPTVLLIGLVARGFVRGRTSMMRIVIVGVAVSLLFGVWIGFIDGRLVAFVAGSGLSLANFLVGALLAALLRRAATAVLGGLRSDRGSRT